MYQRLYEKAFNTLKRKELLEMQEELDLHGKDIPVRRFLQWMPIEKSFSEYTKQKEE